MADAGIEWDMWWRIERADPELEVFELGYDARELEWSIVEGWRLSRRRGGVIDSAGTNEWAKRRVMGQER